MSEQPNAYRLRDDPEYRQGVHLVIAGVILLGVACLITFAIILMLVVPVIVTTLPDLQPAAEAAPGETLFVIVGFVGAEDVSSELYQDITDVLERQPIYDARVIYLDEQPNDAEAALALAESYGASVIIWGNATNNGYDAAFSIRSPVDRLEPRAYRFSFADDDDQARLKLMQFTTALLRAHAADYSYEYDSVVRLIDELAPAGQASAGFDPDILRFYEVSAHFYHEDYWETILLVDAAVESETVTPELLILMAAAYRDAHFLEDLEQQLTNGLSAADFAIDLDPDSPEAHYVKGSLYHDFDQPDLAMTAYEEALSLDPQHENTLRRRSDLLIDEERWEEAYESLTTLIEVAPNNYRYYLQRAEAAIKLDQPDDALADLTNALRAAQAHESGQVAATHIIERHALLLTDLGRSSDALASLNNLANQFPADLRYTLLMGAVFWAEGDSSRAWQHWNEYSSAYGGTNYNAIAWGLALEGYYEVALDLAETHLERNPDDPNGIHTLGFVHLGLGHTDQAIQRFEEALDLGIYYTPIYRDLGDAHYAQGDYAEAIARYETYLLGFTNAEADDHDEVSLRLRFARLRLLRADLAID
ncbi:MAG: tetratricopeptide repeat protein [Chloroflexi bacterium]|nr:tetratricopeptide repeat protein [Chloroflexota bacterium]